VKPMRILLAAVVAVVLAPQAAGAEPADPHIANARAHLDELALDLAQTELDLALRAGNSDRTRLIEIHRMLGIVHAGLDRPEKAVDEFRAVLALDPKAEIAAELGPKIVQPFADAKLSMQGRAPLAVKLEPHRATNTQIVVVIESDPIGMVKQARARFASASGETTVNGAAAPKIALDIPTGAMRANVVALDEYGNRLTELDVSLQVATNEMPPPKEPGLLGWWPLWGGVALAAGGTGIGFAMLARSSRSDLDELEATQMPAYSQVKALDDRGRRQTLYANIAFGAAGVAAIVSTIMFVRRPAARTSVAVAPATDGGVVVLTGGF
jgi:hypothetical protein